MKENLFLGYTDDPAAIARLRVLCEWIDARKAQHAELKTITHWQDIPELNAVAKDREGKEIGFYPVTLIIDRRVRALGIMSQLTQAERRAVAQGKIHATKPKPGGIRGAWGGALETLRELPKGMSLDKDLPWLPWAVGIAAAAAAGGVAYWVMT